MEYSFLALSQSLIKLQNKNLLFSVLSGTVPSPSTIRNSSVDETGVLFGSEPPV